MATTVELSGSALQGVEPHLIATALAGKALPSKVCLGRIKPIARAPALRLSEYLDLSKAASSLPESTNYREKAAASLARMYVNDRLGCCVVSGKAHMFGVWTGNDSPAVALATDAEITSQYHAWCGAGDNGCYISSVLDILKAKGMMLGGKLHKIEGYVSCDWTNQLEVKTVLYLSGASSIGINLPDAWTKNAVWDVTNTKIVGGHDVTPIDYGPEGVYVSSWGRIYLITWPAFMSRKWLDEHYMILGVDWWGADNKAPNFMDTTTLRADLIKIGQGEIPDVDPPLPPPPPPPPPPAPPAAGTWSILTQTQDFMTMIRR